MKRFLSLFLLLVMLFTLAACPAGAPSTGTTGTAPSGGTTGTTGTTGSTNLPAQPNPSYNHGERLEGMGDSLQEGAFVLTGREANGETVDLTLAELTGRLRTSNFTAGVTYRVSEAGALAISGASNRTYDFKGAILSVPGGITVSGCNSITLKNITLLTDTGFSLVGSARTVFDGVEVISSATALTLDAASGYCKAVDCRLVGDTAVWSGAPSVTLTDSYLAGKSCGIRDMSETDLFVENCRISAEGEGIAAEIRSSDSRIWRSTVTAGAAASPAAIYALGGTNLLFAQNCISGSPISVGLKDTVNAVVLLNAAVSVAANGAHSTTVADNNLFGAGEFVDCNYILANGNHTEGHFATSFCDNLSGDGLTDITLRADYGVNEDLLPKVDKDLFVGMERKKGIRTAEGFFEGDMTNFVKEAIVAGEKTVIVAPGAYFCAAGFLFAGETENVTIYGYGVFIEKESYKSSATVGVGAAKNLTMKGFYLDHKENSTGQVVVIGKDAATRTVYAIAGAGMLPNWADREVYPFSNLNASTYGYRAGHPEPYADMGPNADSMQFDAKTGILSMVYGASNFEMIRVGDTLTCRGAGANVIALYESATNIAFEDVTVFGGAGFAFREDKTFGGTEIIRMWDTPGPAAIIDEETYFRYLALEEQYGVDFGVYVDGEGRYRGTPPATSSVDATHSSGAEQGLTLISCVFEQMCDDGTNQHGVHGRLAGVSENADGTVTLTYKNNLSTVGLNNGGKSGNVCAAFRVGDRVYIYTSEGKLLCDTPALTATKKTKTVTNEYGGSDVHYEITVAAGTFDMSGIEGVDFASANPQVKKVCVDNMSRTSNGFFIDNTVVRHIRSRGLLLKGSDGTVQYSSIVNVGMGGIAIRYELEWGESGPSENLVVKNNHIKNSGMYGNVDKNTCISICGLGSRAEDEYLLYNNILLEGNVFEDRNTDYAIYINSARSVRITGNTFLPRKGVASAEDSLAPICIDCAKDVEISGNTWTEASLGTEHRVRAVMNRHVFGEDVGEVEDDIALGEGTDAFKLYLPYVNGDGTVGMSGNWSVGYTSTAATDGFTPFNSTAAGTWICYNGTIWGQKGGFWLQNGYGFAAQANANTAIRFTAPKAGTYAIRVTDFNAPRGDGSADGYFAIVKGDTVIWPAGGDGNYAKASNYRVITQKDNLTAMQDELAGFTVTLEAGECLYFVAKQKDGKWSNFTFLPMMIPLAEK